MLNLRAKNKNTLQKCTRYPIVLAIGFLCSVCFACSSWSRQKWLDETYKPGMSRKDGEIVTMTQSNEWFDSAMLQPEGMNMLPIGAEAALGPNRVSRADGFDVYDVRMQIGNRQQRRFVSRCDFIFFDKSELIVGAYRRLGPCNK